jgi:multiple sugar transport system substrate-binding protein
METALMTQFSRRQFVASIGSTALGLNATFSHAQSGTRLRCFWWGNPDRDKRTKALLEGYATKNNLQIGAETVGWGDYWTKLATQVAGGNAPDLIQMDYRYLFEYARRNTLLPLDKLLPLHDFTPNDRNGGKVDGKLYGVNLGSNSKGMVYDTGMLAKVGVKSIDPKWSWDDFSRITAEISKVNPGKYWGASDNSRWEQGLEQWLNSQGKSLYNMDGQAGFSKDDVATWFSLWDKMRKAGSIAPAEVGATNNGKVEEYEVTRGLAAMSFVNSNQIVAFQALNKNPLALSVFPRTQGGSSGHYIKPSQMMSVSAKSKEPEKAAKIIEYMVTNPEGVKILGIERGVPCSASARATLTPDLDALGKMQIEFIAALSKTAVPLPPPPPKGAGEVENLLKRVADSVAFGKSSIADGAAQFHSESIRILARAA